MREVLVDPAAVVVEEKNACFMVPYSVGADGAVTFDLTAAKQVQQDWADVKKAGVSFANVVFGS